MKALAPPSWLASANLDKHPPQKPGLIVGFIHVFGEAVASLPEELADLVPIWQKANLKGGFKQMMQLNSPQGPCWVVKAKNQPEYFSHEGKLEESGYSEFRDLAGALLSMAKSQNVQHLCVISHQCSDDQLCGFLTGLDLAAYSFRDVWSGRDKHDMSLWIVDVDKKVPREAYHRAAARGQAVNLARHFVNLPPNELHPVSFANTMKAMASGTGLKIEIWDHNRLKKEKMGLHLAVGQGAPHPPRMVKLSWRPGARRGGGKKSSSGAKPIALVGKGITFDTGGLDIKPSSGMRLMKKDMGGAAAVAAVALWAAQVKLPVALDVYLALAENSVDGTSFRPSDLVTARSGQVVEIDNTDAEGRLVLADVIDVAVTAKEKPEIVIDVATLTGAIKVALGAEIAGLFANDDQVAAELAVAGQAAGDLNWRMPLAERYWSGMSSPFADFKNSADGFGGAITAALFLSRFTRGVRWAHLDIYAWNDKANGPYTFAGGNGQAVQCLIEWLEGRAI